MKKSVVSGRENRGQFRSNRPEEGSGNETGMIIAVMVPILTVMMFLMERML